MQTQPRAKSVHDGLTGISARMHDEDVIKYKEMMERLKAKHGKGFSLSDLVQAITYADSDVLNELIVKYKSFKDSQSPNIGYVKKMNISDDAKARIAAILAEEANRGG